MAPAWSCAAASLVPAAGLGAVVALEQDPEVEHGAGVVVRGRLLVPAAGLGGVVVLEQDPETEHGAGVVAPGRPLVPAPGLGRVVVVRAGPRGRTWRRRGRARPPARTSGGPRRGRSSFEQDPETEHGAGVVVRGRLLVPAPGPRGVALFQ